MAEKNKYLDLDVINDFGFTFTDEEDVVVENTQYANLQEEVEDLKKRLQACHQIFLPLLQNLAKDPDKPMIKWPNRKDVIDKQIEQLNKITKTK
jgi:hypothetical protein